MEIAILSMQHLFFFNDTATTEIYTLSLHDALPIYQDSACIIQTFDDGCVLIDHLALESTGAPGGSIAFGGRSEEHTSELQSPDHIVCRLLLEKKNYEKHQSFQQPSAFTHYTSRAHS